MVNVLSSSECTKTSDGVVALSQRPEFRRATEAMRMAFYACKEAIEKANLSADEQQNMIVIIGSNYGELEVTKDFINEWYTEKLARPMLFQNSLHNSVLGFLSIQLKLVGPGLTISNGANTSQDLLELAETLLSSGENQVCLVCHFDSYMQKLCDSVGYKDFKPVVSESASASVLRR